LSRGREWPEASRIGPLCARHLAVATLAARLADGDHARTVLMEPPRFEWWPAFLPPAHRAILASRDRGLGRSGLNQDCATFVLCQTILCPLCPFGTFLVSDLDRPFCHLDAWSFRASHPCTI
jgi:hypothetical protein